MVTLCPEVHALQIEDDIVLLHRGQDRYYCLRPNAQPLALSQNDRIEGLSDHQARDLRALDLVCEGSSQSVRALRPSMPTRSWRGQAYEGPPITLREHLAGFWAFGLANLFSVSMPLSSFKVLTDRPGCFCPQIQQPPSALADRIDSRSWSASPARLGLRQALALYDAMLPWLGPDGACLARSLHLCAYLKSLGHAPRLVIAVRTWPFLAHCWLQQDDILLDDDLEHIAGYQILWASS